MQRQCGFIWLFLVASFASVCLAQPSPWTYGTTSTGIRIYVRFDNLPTAPSSPDQVTFDLTTNPDKPGVTLNVGIDEDDRFWRVKCEDTNNSFAPADISFIRGQDPDYDYLVTVLDENGDPGAGDVDEITLDPGTGQTEKWGKLSDGEIDGDLGDLTVELNGYSPTSNEGSARIVIGGDLTGDVFIENRGAITVAGSVLNTATIEIGSMDGYHYQAWLRVTGNLAATVTIGVMTGGDTEIIVGDGSNASDITGSVTIDRMDEIGDPPLAPRIHVYGDVTGTLRIENGVLDEDVVIDIDGNLDGSLTSGPAGSPTLGAPMIGEVTIGGGSGTIHFSAVGDSGVSRFSAFISTGVFTGDVEVNTIYGTVSFSEFDGTLENLSGAGTDLYGVIKTTGQFHAGSVIEIDDMFSYLSLDDQIQINTSQTATTSRGDIIVTDQMEGHIIVYGDYDGDITIQGTDGLESTASIEVTGKFKVGSVIQVDYDADGTITVGNELGGDLAVDGDVNGDVTVGKMNTNGRILIGGLLDADVVVNTGTVSGSLIQVVAGMAADSTIQVNADEGDFDAAGAIHIGNPDLAQQDNITTEGCIRVYDEDESGNTGSYGNLTGTITVNGCHGTTAQDNVCIDGDFTAASIIYIQTGCVIQVPYPEYDCDGCP